MRQRATVGDGHPEVARIHQQVNRMQAALRERAWSELLND